MTLFADIDRKFPWSFLGFVAGVAFGLFGIYTVFFYDKYPALDIEVANDAPVFSVREQVPELDILFQGTSIREAHQGLAVVTLKISNNGKAAIRASDFDAKDPLALTLLNGKIIRVDLLDSSEDYFKTVFSQVTTTNGTIVIPPFIMEQGRFMALQVLVLHDEKVRPQFKATGKVAGIAQLSIKPCMVAEPVSPKRSAFSGDLPIQGLRVVVYGGGLITAIVAIVTSSIGISSRISRRRNKELRIRRERILLEYLQNQPPDIRHQLRPFARLCIQHDFAATHLLMRILRSEAKDPQELQNDEELRMILRQAEMLDPRFDARQFELTPKLIKHLQDMLRFIAKNM